MHILARATGFVSAAALVALAGCKAVYAPNIVSTPLLRQRGEVRATVDARNLQLAVAPTNHLGVMVNGYHRDETNDPKPDEEKQHGRGDFVELGAGGFTGIARPYTWLPLQVEAYGGVGVGTVKQDLTPAGGVTRHFEAQATRFFIAPTLGTTTKYYDVAASLRVVGVRYHDVATEGYVDDQQLEGDGFAGIEERTWLFVEPCVTVRAGYKWVKLQLQVGKSYKLTTGDLPHDSGMVTLGLNVDLFRAFE
jgi:hypothetical protein